MGALISVVLVAFSLVAVVVLLRLGRQQHLIDTRCGRCDVCGRSGLPVVGVHYGKNTGMLVVRTSASLEATLCRRCSLSEGGKMTAHTAVLGWWGTISFFVTLFILPWNSAQLLWALSLPSTEALSAEALEGHREYATALLATKDQATVVHVLSRAANAPPAQVERFLATLPRPGAGLVEPRAD